MKNNRGGGGGLEKRGGGGRHHKGKPSFAPNRHKKVEVTFNASDRLDYLTGFSKRKKERRAFGLAMQKVKDRQAKVDERKDRREAEMEKIQDIERNKKALRKGLAGDNDVDGDVSDDNNDSDADETSQKKEQHEKELSTFQDEHTTTQFGGLVSVTTTFGIPDDEDDDSIEFFKREPHGKSHIDTEQKKAGDVNTFMEQVKSKMPKKNSGKRGGKKGQHGASTMSGMGHSATLKMAQKTLKKFKARDGGGRGGGNERGAGGGKGKKRKGGRR